MEHELRIVVEPSDYVFLNLGDTAMLEIAFARLRTMFPEAIIEVFTDDSERLSQYCPTAVPINIRGRETWFEDGYLFSSLSRLSHHRIITRLRHIERSLRRRWPSIAEWPIRMRAKLAGASEELGIYLRALSRADLYVVTGMGGITDVFKEYALGVLDTLALAVRRGIPTAMFGQGIGPIEDETLKSRAKEVLPRVDLIALREQRASRPLLQSLGVADHRIVITGDDAIEFAYVSRPEKLGSALGINLRAARYSEIDCSVIDKMRLVIQKVAMGHKAPFIPLPISQVPCENDSATIERLLTGWSEMSGNQEDAVTRTELLERIAQCRLVITGSYHAGVFALSQGVPVVGIARSDYYRDKFLGLADQFGTGCEVVLLTDPAWPGRVEAAIETLWASAERMRPQLLDAAGQQMKLSRAAYRMFHRLSASRMVDSNLAGRRAGSAR